MNRLEDRLRDAFGAAAETVRPESVGVLREQSRPPGARHFAPLAVAAAVAIVIIGASAITPLALVGGHQARPPSNGAGRPSPAPSPGPSDAMEAAVPVVVGMQVSQATAVLEAVPLSVAIVYQGKTAVPPGTVSAQTPAGGMRVPFGTTITLTVAGVPVSSASPARGIPAPPGTRTLSSSELAVTIAIPASWTLTPYYSGEAYDGASGWVMLAAKVNAVPPGLTSECTTEATSNVNHPYGLHPRIVYRGIDGRPGCLIFPSSDAVSEARRSGGPTFQQAAALVPYQLPLADGATYLLILADPGNVATIAGSVQLHQ